VDQVRQCLELLEIKLFVKRSCLSGKFGGYDVGEC